MECWERDNLCFWIKEVVFYLDGVFFVYKMNLMSVVMILKVRVWYWKSEGLYIISKGLKDLVGGKCFYVMVVIVYGKGVIFNEFYEKMNG